MRETDLKAVRVEKVPWILVHSKPYRNNRIHFIDYTNEALSVETLRPKQERWYTDLVLLNQIWNTDLRLSDFNKGIDKLVNTQIRAGRMDKKIVMVRYMYQLA